MADRWTGWKSFPDDYFGDYIQAPIGPGVYEICRTSDREQLAFGCTQNVAQSLSAFLKPGKVLSLEPCDPGVNRRTGDLQHAAHTDLVPALIVQFDHVQPGVVAIGAKPAPGAEYMYRLELAAPTALRAVVLDGSTTHSGGDTPVDVDVYLLDATAAGTGCIASGDAILETTVGPGTFYVVVDTTAASPDVAGEYTLAVVACEATDTRCAR